MPASFFPQATASCRIKADIKGRKVAVLATDGVEQVEITEPVKALKRAGARVTIASPKGGDIQGMNHDEKGDAIGADQALDDARPDVFDALVLPGGVANPDRLRTMPKPVASSG
ncbi:MAG: DJ-1/PfpI family protein [Acetobacteraceae bacterium]